MSADHDAKREAFRNRLAQSSPEMLALLDAQKLLYGDAMKLTHVICADGDVIGKATPEEIEAAHDAFANYSEPEPAPVEQPARKYRGRK